MPVVDEKRARAEVVYHKTKRFAKRNAQVQALSGVVGMGANLVVDVAAIPFYRDLWNDIRQVYGDRNEEGITLATAKAYLQPNLSFLLQDLLIDKALGSIPVAGGVFNYVCAKALSWRLGAWFGLLSAIGGKELPDSVKATSTMQLVREFFPANRSVWKFEEPDPEKFIAFLSALDGLTRAEAERRVDDALRALAGQKPEPTHATQSMEPSLSSEARQQ